MFFRIRDKFQRARFNFMCRDIYRTAPPRLRDAHLSFVSLVSHRDFLMYLIAIKSISRFFSGGRIVVLDDGTLTPEDRAALAKQLPLAQIFTFRDVQAANTPKGGCWERLLLIAHLVRDSYVIQVDSDTLTLRAMSEVENYVAENCSFTLLGAGSFPVVESMPDACARAKRSGHENMEPQGVSERSLDGFPDSANRKYVRGNAAFAGFARGSFTAQDVEYFSKNMAALCGTAKWNEWGSEQVTSNLIIANSPKTGVLEHPKYTSYYAVPQLDYSQSTFIHFMGGIRFQNGCYLRLARGVIRQLMAGAPDRSNSEHGTSLVEDKAGAALAPVSSAGPIAVEPKQDN